MSRKILSLLFWILCLAVFAEAMSWGILRWQFGPAGSASSFFSSRFFLGPPDADGCYPQSYLRLHPFFAYSYDQEGKCSRALVNAYGFRSPEFPLERDPNFFTILVLGGSFAELSTFGGKEGSALEQILNASYIAPNQKKFRILNAALVAGRQPMQANILNLLAHIADGAISLEGRGESYAYGGFRSLADMMLLTPQNDFSESLRMGLLVSPARHFFSWTQTTPLLNRSYFLNLLSSSFLYVVEPQKDNNPRYIPRISPSADPSTRKQNFIAEYSQYLKSMTGIAAAHNLPLTIFFQPVAALAKPLTPEEQSRVGDLSYGANYQEMIHKLLALNSANVPLVSLVDVFQKIDAPLYQDPTHISPEGYRILAEKMASLLARDWRLRRKAAP